MAGEVTNVIYRGSMIRFYINTGNREIFIEKQYDSDNNIEETESVVLKWEPERLVAFDQDGKQFTTSHRRL